MGNRRRRLPLELLVFVVGSATLGSEIAVARLIAPFFGDSTIEPPLEGGTVYTDDKAPVEWLVDKSLLDYAGGDE